MRIQKKWRVLAGVVACLAATACESETELTTGMITVENVPDLFSWSVTDLENVSGGIQYFWTVTGTQAIIDVDQSISSGSAIIQVRDGAGVVVYEHQANNAVYDTTAVSSAGLWQVAIVLSKLDGGFNVSAVRLDTLSNP